MTILKALIPSKEKKRATRLVKSPRKIVLPASRVPKKANRMPRRKVKEGLASHRTRKDSPRNRHHKLSPLPRKPIRFANESTRRRIA